MLNKFLAKTDLVSEYNFCCLPKQKQKQKQSRVKSPSVLCAPSPASTPAFGPRRILFSHWGQVAEGEACTMEGTWSWLRCTEGPLLLVPPPPELGSTRPLHSALGTTGLGAQGGLAFFMVGKCYGARATQGHSGP